ncbi:hypothetical protein N0V90_006198 [Kalmusia sp. IMI 367209]|nr:hypothetical protein N0V90_006198 [Kalmusia sp. IMI 367209]
MAHILIIGAGVIGLQTANDLLDAGYKVTILAKHWPGDETIEYTSPCNDPENDPSSPRMWYSNLVQDFVLLPPAELPPNGPKSGHSYTSIVIDPSKYLTYLLNRAKSLRAQTITAELPTSNSFSNAITAAFGHLSSNDAPPSLVINCTGLGALKLCDPNMYPIRGQTLLVRITPAPPTSRITIYDSTPVTYIVPRQLTTFSSNPSTATYFIGGTNDADNWDPEPTPEITEGILERVKAVLHGWASDDAQIEILREQVGLRPGRRGGPRIAGEIEDFDVAVGGSEATRKVKVVHQYGHAGAGFQCSIGSGRKTLAIVKDILG